jgi:uncharacterized protein
MIGLTKGGFNALGALLTPLLSVILPVSVAVGVILPMLIVGDAFALYTYWREWDGSLVARLLPGAVLGALAGAFLLVQLSANVLRISLAVFVLVLVVYKFVSDRLAAFRYQPRRWHTPATGALAGLASGLFNNGGPVLNSYLLLRQVPPRTFVGTTALYFALVNLVKVVGYLYTGILNLPLLLSFWWVFLFIPLGIWGARRLVLRLNPRAFEWVIIVLLLLTSALLFWQSL